MKIEYKEIKYRCPKCGQITTHGGNIQGIQKTFCDRCKKKMQVMNIQTDGEYEPKPIETFEVKRVTVENQVIENFESDFTFNAPIDINESKTERTIISGVLICEGVSTNGNLYTIETLEKLDGLKDIPIYVGTGQNNRHSKASGVVGRVLKTMYDKVKRKVLFIAEIFNKAIAETVKAGWGISVAGNAMGVYVLDSCGKLLTRIEDLVLNHVQLLTPNTRRGMDSAKVENVQVQESMVFNNAPKLTKSHIAQIIGILAARGELD